MNRRYLLAFSLFLEVIVLVFLTTKLVRKAVLGDQVFVSPINKKDLTRTPLDGLTHFYEPKPNSTQTLDPVLLSNLGYPKDHTVRYAINADGLNQLTNIPLSKNNAYKILTLGDSFTFGMNVNTEENYPSQLQNILDTECTTHFEVINLGVAGYDIQYAVERFKIRGKKYNPDMIIWLILDDDMLRMDEQIYAKLPAYRKTFTKDDLQALIKQHIFFPAWNKARDEAIGDLGGKEKVLQLQKHYFYQLNPYFDKKLILTGFPEFMKSYGGFLQEYATSRKEIFIDNTLPTIYHDPTNYLADKHPSPQGHKIIARSIFTYLTTHHLIPCN